jgi:hypothetical protein
MDQQFTQEAPFACTSKVRSHFHCITLLEVRACGGGSYYGGGGCSRGLPSAFCFAVSALYQRFNSSASSSVKGLHDCVGTGGRPRGYLACPCHNCGPLIACWPDVRPVYEPAATHPQASSAPPADPAESPTDSAAPSTDFLIFVGLLRL